MTNMMNKLHFTNQIRYTGWICVFHIPHEHKSALRLLISAFKRVEIMTNFLCFSGITCHICGPLYVLILVGNLTVFLLSNTETENSEVVRIFSKKRKIVHYWRRQPVNKFIYFFGVLFKIFIVYSFLIRHL